MPEVNMPTRNDLSTPRARTSGLYEWSARSRLAACTTGHIFRRGNGDEGAAARDHSNAAIALHRETVTAENVNRLFVKHGVPSSFDLVSIDIDGNDYWVWKAIARSYRPRVAVVELNAAIPPDVSVAMPYEPEFRRSLLATGFREPSVREAPLPWVCV